MRIECAILLLLAVPGCATLGKTATSHRPANYISMELDNAMIELEAAAARVEQIALFDSQRYDQIEKMLLTVESIKSVRRPIGGPSITAARQCVAGRRAAKRIQKAAGQYRRLLANSRRVPRRTNRAPDRD